MTCRDTSGSVKSPEIENYTASERYWYDIGVMQGMIKMCRPVFELFFAYAVFSVLVTIIQFFASGTYTPSYALGGMIALGGCLLLLNFFRLREIRKIIKKPAEEAYTDDL